MIQNAFQGAAANDMFGYARVVSVSADTIVFDKVVGTPAIPRLRQTSMMAPAKVDILFGEYITDVDNDHDLYVERSFQFEAAYPGLGPGEGNTPAERAADLLRYEYGRGMYAGTLALNLPLQDKATMTMNFSGTDVLSSETARGVARARLGGADAALRPTRRTAYNTVTDLARLRVTGMDEEGLTTDFKSLVINIDNNVSPEAVLGVLGAKFVNFGSFDVNVEAQVVFTSPAVISAILDNDTVGMDAIIKNDNGVIIIDLPSSTLGGGNRSFPLNESVLVDFTGEPFEDAALGTSLGVSTIPVPLG